MKILKNDWSNFLEEEFSAEYYQKLRQFLIKEYSEKTVYPDKYNIFNAFHYTSFAQTKVVILGQDPYHGKNQAHGLSFSVLEGVDRPPSLANIFKELQSDLSIPEPLTNNLTAWAKQGVFLLNTVLTVRANQAQSHQGLGWEIFTDKVMQVLNSAEQPLVFILWGRFAQNKKKFITNKKHLIIESVHPSPLSAYRGFFGSRPFSRTNEFLRNNGLGEIDWSL